jgi:predicted Zn-dependent protease
LLWRILQRFPDARWAQDSLERLYFETGNTTGLYQLYLKQLPRSPQDVALKSNLAATALLLKTNLNQACQWAAEVYAQSPGNPDVVSTYAYALHLQGRNQEGLAAMQKLNHSQLEQRSVALYYGLLLSATGKASGAAPYLQIARTDGQLLPEEKQLLAETDKVSRMK